MSAIVFSLVWRFLYNLNYTDAFYNVLLCLKELYEANKAGISRVESRPEISL
jgi:hypothetical protein